MDLNIPNFYDSNAALLQKHHPHLYNKILNSSLEPVGEIKLSPNGKPNVLLQDPDGQSMYLHDQNDPERETAQFLKMVPENSTGVVALIGMGLGYTPLALLQARPSIRHFIIFDLEPGIFLHALHVMDLSPILTDPRLLFGIDPSPAVEEILAPASRALQTESIHTLKHLPTLRMNPEAYESLGEKIFSCVNEYNVAGATVSVFGKDFMENRFSHLTSIRHHYLLENLQHAFQDVPAILVAGGPSLDKNIHLIKEAKDKAVIIAVDTVLPALLAHGIAPDFLTSIDPEHFTHEKFADVLPQIHDVSLICAAWVSPKVPKTFPENRVFWTFAGNRIEHWLNRLLGGTVLTTGAKTVAHLNFVAATMLGCSPMIFVGQDLAFSDDKDHAGHTVLTNQTAISDFLKSEKDIVWVDGINGGKVPTNRAFYSMKIQFEKMIQSQPGLFINATEGGAHIQGTQALTLEDALKQHCDRKRGITRLLETFFQTQKTRDMTLMIAEFRSLQRQIRQVQKTIKKADGLTRDLCEKFTRHQKNGTRYRSVTSLPKAMQQQLCEIDAHHKEIDEAINIWQLLEEVTMDGLRTSERQKHIMAGMDGDPEKYMEWLLTGLNRLHDINTVRTRVISALESQLTRTIRHYEKETKISDAIRTEKNAEKNLLRLAELYYDSGDIMLARRALQKIEPPIQNPGRYFFYLGCVNAYSGKPEQAEQFLARSCEQDPKYIEMVNRFRTRIGAEYYGYVQRLKNDGYDTKRMILKGLRHCWNHKQLNHEIKTIAVKDLSFIREQAEAGTIANAEEIIKTWMTDIDQHRNLRKVLGKNMLATFQQYVGNLFISQHNYADAATYFQKALEQAPQKPELRIFLADTYFADSQYDQGIEQLKKAIDLDRNYAVYWENIGDNLKNAGLFEEAVSAYEQCFVTLPEKVDLLKKIGDCYQELHQDQAALEAYRQLQGKLKQYSCEMSQGA